MKTKGRYAIEQKGFAVKANKDNGDLIDWKVVMKKDAREESRFDLDNMPILTGASKTNGLNVEVTPMSNGQPLPPLMIPVNLMGAVRVTDEGDVSLTLRMMRNVMNAQGAGFDLITDATLCLDCVVGDMESLQEQTDRAAAPDVDADPLLTGDAGSGQPDPAKAPGKLGEAARKAKGGKPKAPPSPGAKA